MRLCEQGDVKKEGCRNPHELCVGDPEFGFDLREGSGVGFLLHLLYCWFTRID